MEVLPSEQIEKLHVTADFIEYKTAADSSPQLVPTSEMEELDSVEDEQAEETIEVVVDTPIEEPVDESMEEPAGEFIDELVDESNDEPIEEPAEEMESETSNNTLDTKEVASEEIDEPLPSVSKANKNRELKSILALSKEAKLDTNIAHKRESRKIELSTGKVQKSDSRSSSTGSNSEQVTPKHKTNIDFFSNYTKFLGSAQNDESDSEDKQKKSNANSPLIKKSKRKRNSSAESPAGGSSGEDEKKFKKIQRTDSKNAIGNLDRDKYCWHCHRDGAWIFCKTCPRSYHQKCLKQSIANPEHWPCPECVSILKAENTQTRSSAMKHMTLEHLCGLLKYALKRMMQYSGSEPFLHPVNKEQFPDYNEYVTHPMDLTRLQNNIRDNLYGSTEAFLADAKWILHNSIIFNSYQSKLTSIARGIFKICKQEMSEIETCAECYLNANTKKQTWFIEVCSKPHVLLWAKLKGFPYWPAKAMCTNSTGLVDVRFFGAHDRAWVPIKECFLYSQKDPNSNKQKRNDIAECVKELECHLNKIREVYGAFHHAPCRMPYDPENEEKQLQMLIPNYSKNGEKRNQSAIAVKIDYSSETSNDMSELSPTKHSNTSVSSSSLMTANYATTKVSAHEFDKFVEGYGTDADDLADDNKKGRKIRKERESYSDDEDDYENSVNSDSEKKDDDNSKENDDFETQIDPNTKPDEQNCTLSSVVPTKSKNSAGGRLSEDSNARKRISSDDYSLSPSKLSRRNSDQSIQSDSSRMSNISERINKLDVPEDVEISLGNEKPGRVSASDWLMMKMSQNQNVAGNEKAQEKPDHSEETSTSETDVSDIEQAGSKLSQNKSTTEIDSANKAKQSSEDISALKTMKTYGRKNVKTDSQTSEDSKEKSKVDSKIEASGLSSKTTSSTAKVLDKKIVENGNTSEKEELEKKSVQGNSDKKCETTEESGIEGKDEGEKDRKHSSDKQAGKMVTKRLALFEDFTDVDSTSDTINPSPPSNENLDESKEKSSNSFKHTGGRKSSTSSISSVTKEKQNDAKLKDSIKIATVINNINKKRSRKQEFETNVTKTKLNSEVDLVKKNKATMKIVDVSEIINAKEINREVTVTVPPPRSATATGAPESVQIKSESESDSDSDSEGDTAYMEAKKRYFSALNISLKSDVEKTKLNMKTQAKGGLATRSRTKEDIATRATENMTSNDSNKDNTSDSSNGRQMLLKKKQFQNLKEITIKPLSSMQVPTVVTKQRARKSFPTSPSSTASLLNNKQLSLTVKKPTNIEKNPEIRLNEENRNGLMITTSTSSNLSPANEISSSQPPPLVRSNVPRDKTPGWALPPPPTNQLHPLHTSGGQILTMVQHPVQLQQNRSMGSVQMFPASSSQCTIVNGPTSISAGSGEQNSQQSANCEELSILRSVLPENLSRAVSELMCRPPPKLKPRPPGPLSTSFDEGVPSSAGPVTQQVNVVSHRFADYFRGLIIETIKDLGSCTENTEAQITSLRRENEELKHKHAEEILEVKKNVSSILRDIQKSILDERNKLIEDTRSACEAESIRRVEEAKSKQWCANCFKEAQFYCCWNTSYCDYPCQQKHWVKHMKTCSQNATSSSNTASAASSPKTPSSIVLRPTAAPKQLQNKTYMGKPTKVMVSRPGMNNKSVGVLNVAKPPVSKVSDIGMLKKYASSKQGLQLQGSGGQHTITLLESTPGNFEILGNHGPISVGGKLISNSSIISKIKTGNVITVTSPSNSSQTGKLTSSNKAVVSSGDKSQSIVIDDNDK